MIRNEKTRQFIIEKTACIFNKKGYVGTYLSDLTEATGLTKGSIYGNFKDKNEVALEAFRYNYNFQTEPLLQMIDKEERSSDKLLVFLNFYKSKFKAIFENGGCAILNTAVDADNGNELLKQEVIQKIHNWSDKIVSIINEGIQRGELKSINAEEFSYKMISMIEGSVLIAKTLDRPEILLKNIAFLEEEIIPLKIN